MTRRWEVDVRVDGNLILTIGQNLSGIENIDDFADEVRAAGEHLLSFIGPAEGGGETPSGPPCPKCGEETADGFGLAGGGYGPYTYCTSDACDYFDKVFLPDDAE